MKIILNLTILACVSFFSSCASYQQSTREFRNSWDAGDEKTALVNLEKAGKSIKPGHDEELLWNLEMTSVARANQLPELYDFHLDWAKTLVDEKFGGGLIDPQKKGLGNMLASFMTVICWKFIGLVGFLKIRIHQKFNLRSLNYASSVKKPGS